MKPSLQRLKTAVEHPFTKLATGMILLGSGLATAYSDIANAEHSAQFGVHHGVLLFGLVQVLGSLPDLIDGLGKTIEVAEKRNLTKKG